MQNTPDMKTIIEPFKIKTIEPLPLLTFDQRKAAIAKASYNLFNLRAENVTFDLLTDSGTGAMSARQWSGMMIGDESYAGSKSFHRLEKTVQDLTGYEFIVPTHQGRAAEFLLMKALVKPGQMVLGNTHFDTTRANIEMANGEAIDLPALSNQDSQNEDPFKGNVDLVALKNVLTEKSDQVAMIVMTLTNNSVGGQPVSMENLKQARSLAKEFSVPFFLDVARFAENAFFIQLREPAYKNTSVTQITKEMFSLADGAWMSSKKDAFVNIGGFLAMNDSSLAEEIRAQMVLTEGFPTYGGLAGRDLEALAIGLEEVLDEKYLTYRIRSVEYFGKGIEQSGLKVVKPFGGHAVYIDAGASLSHIPFYQFPAQSLSVAFYENLGIRSVEVGTVMLGRKNPETGEQEPAPKELVRLAMPRRVYTQSHVDYMIEGMTHLVKNISSLKGYEFEYEAPFLRHFSAKFKKL